MIPPRNGVILEVVTFEDPLLPAATYLTGVEAEDVITAALTVS